MIRYIVDLGDPTAFEIDTYETADRSRPYYLSYAENALADENLCIDRSPDGFLKAVYFGAQDRTADILLNVLEIAATGGNAAREPVEEIADKATCTGTVVSEWMDPYDQQALKEFNGRLCGRYVEVPNFGSGPTPMSACPTGSVCFSTASTMNAYLRAADGTILQPAQETVNSARDIGWVNVKGAFFNRRITMLDFNKGSLTSLRIRKESEILGLSEFPLKATERLLAVPGNAIGMAFAGYKERLLYLQKRKELTDAEAVRTGAAAADPTLATEALGCIKTSGS